MTQTTLQSYPNSVAPNPVDCATALNKIAQIRAIDQTLWTGLQNQFLSGRSVTKVPASSTDTANSQVGDFNVTSAYAYFCVNNGGAAEWVRIAVATF